MNSHERRMEILLTPLFLLSLSVLLLNDWYLKYQFHNWMTGKLSDLSGLVVFYLFLVALFPRSFKFLVWLVTLLFIFWKSPMSQGAIDWWNSWIPLRIGRVVDYTDYLVLPVLLVARRGAMLEHKKVALEWRYSMIMLSIFAITGTSSMPVRTQEEIAFDKQLSKVRKERVCTYEFDREDINPQLANEIEALLSTLPSEERLEEHGVKLDEWESDVMSAITYDFGTFYINTWVFHSKPEKMTEYNITPIKRCDVQIASNEQGSAIPFHSAHIKFLRKGAGAEIKALDLKLCDLPERKNKQEALEYFRNEILRKVEHAFY